jgi:ribosomal protein S1
LTDLGEIAASIDAFEQSLVSPQWVAVNKRFPPQLHVLGTVMNVMDFGVFVEVEVGISGLIPARRLPVGFGKMDQFSPGERIIVEVVSVQPFQRKTLYFTRAHLELRFRTIEP